MSGYSVFMAYDKQAIIDQCFEIIEKEGIRKASELIAYLPISAPTFYLWELDKLEEIRQKIYDQRIKRKAKMRKKWIESDIPALQIAAYKLESEEEELEILTTSKVKQDLKVELPKIHFTTTDATEKHSSL